MSAMKRSQGKTSAAFRIYGGTILRSVFFPRFAGVALNLDGVFLSRSRGY